MSDFYVRPGDEVTLSKIIGESDVYHFAGIAGDPSPKQCGTRWPTTDEFLDHPRNLDPGRPNGLDLRSTPGRADPSGATPRFVAARPFERITGRSHPGR